MVYSSPLRAFSHFLGFHGFLPVLSIVKHQGLLFVIFVIQCCSCFCDSRGSSVRPFSFSFLHVSIA
ncbi:hypothetical protein BDZ91DRAFT_720691 [Kalaharituber pfeilii]|nr:hypothetical protein BDZ91DRAFT_720691 [Kalaharituber pfeilii]